MKKKILSLVLVVAMLASMLVLAPVSGATEFDGTVAVTNAYGFAGETVSVDVVLTTDQPVYKFQFAFDYDKSKMTLDGVDFAPGYSFWPISGDAEIDAMVAEAPFDTIGWNRSSGADPIDASEGTVVATMNFTLNEDVLGDAFVSIVPSPINNIAIDSGSVGAKIYNFDYVSGGVTVLPEGYLDPNENVASDFGDLEMGWAYWNSTLGDIIYVEDYESLETAKADADGVAIIGYETEDTSLVVPSTIDGLPVKVIYSKAFAGAEFVSVVLPESVELVQDYAFNDCASLTTVYVCNDAIEIGTKAFGYSVTFRSNGKENKSTLLTKEDGATPLTTLFSSQGSGAETYATDWEIGFVAATVAKVIFDDLVYFVAGNLPAPGMAVNGDQITVAWKIGDTTYLPGDTMTITEDTTLEPVTIAKPDMTSTYGFKPTDSPATTAMRFTTTLAKADYETFAGVAESLGGRVEMGTLITPARFVSKAGALTKEALDALSASNNNAQTYIDIDTTGKYFSLEDDIYTFAGSVYGFKGTNYNLDYAAAFYMSVVVGEGETEETLFTVYSDFEFANNRKPLAAAKAVYEVATTNAVKDAVLNFIQQYEPTYGEES